MTKRTYRLFVDLTGTADTQKNLEKVLEQLIEFFAQRNIELCPYLISDGHKRDVNDFVKLRRMKTLKGWFSSTDIENIKRTSSSFSQELQFGETDIIALIDDHSLPLERLKFILGREISSHEAERYFIHYEGDLFAPIPFTDYFEKMMEKGEKQIAEQNNEGKMLASSEEAYSTSLAPHDLEK
ncbi:MAG: hypothetical protein V1746_08535 [bacterium]